MYVCMMLLPHGAQWAVNLNSRQSELESEGGSVEEHDRFN